MEAIYNGALSVNYFRKKNFIVDIWQGPNYVFRCISNISFEHSLDISTKQFTNTRSVKPFPITIV